MAKDNGKVPRLQTERKVTKVGNSFGIILPPEVMEHLNIKQGGNAHFELDEDGKVIIRKSQSLILPKGIDAEFLIMVDEMISEYDETFKELVDR
jgi:putative addiction module antidote